MNWLIENWFEALATISIITLILTFLDHKYFKWSTTNTKVKYITHNKVLFPIIAALIFIGIFMIIAVGWSFISNLFYYSKCKPINFTDDYTIEKCPPRNGDGADYYTN